MKIKSQNQPSPDYPDIYGQVTGGRRGIMLIPVFSDILIKVSAGYNHPPNTRLTKIKFGVKIF